MAARLNRMADLLEIEDANPFRVRAYRNAARTVKGLARPVADLIKHKEDLTASRVLEKTRRTRSKTSFQPAPFHSWKK